jgi:hypothetical protein
MAKTTKPLKLTGKPAKSLTKNGLTLKEERFCNLYATDREFFGNGVQSYIEAYNPDTKAKNWYQTARKSASDLLTKPHIIDRINELLELDGFNDVNADKQLKFLISQHADFNSKLGALKEYNKLKQRITEKMDITTKGEAVIGFNFIVPKDSP